jgi:hypothetical protein
MMPRVGLTDGFWLLEALRYGTRMPSCACCRGLT